jgi:cytochrome b
MARVWDPVVRLFHWGLVASFAAAWLTAEGRSEVHQWAGFAAAGLIAMRLLWGVFGSHYARFGQFVRGPRAVASYLRSIIIGNEARYVGHNPAGGAMVLALLASISVTAFTGWMMTTDAFFGEDWVQNLHSLVANGMIVLIAFHIGGVLLASYRHRENLLHAMLTGHKKAAEPGDVG